MKFIDEIQLELKAGNGGNGIVSFRHEAHVDRGGPDGGDGGDGGNVIFVPNSGINTLFHLKLKKRVIAQAGENGRSKNQYGAKGKDTIVKVPFGTVIFKDGHLLFDVTEEKEYVIANGGKGGKGNVKFKNFHNTAPKISENGDQGEHLFIYLELKVLADVGFVGKPNAGKSTLLSKISNAKPKIATYDFTTINPQLGFVVIGSESFVVADLPGLIKGASIGKGLGFKFLKHIERCKIIAHVLDFGITEKDPIKDYEQINQELSSYNLSLESRKQVVVANKMDIKGFKEKLKIFKKKYPDLKVVKISALEEINISKLKQVLNDELKLADEIVYQNNLDEVTITLEKDFEIIKLHEGLYELKGPKVEYFYHKIPLDTYENMRRFNMKLKCLGVWKELKNQGIQSGDTVRILSFEFEWEREF